MSTKETLPPDEDAKDLLKWKNNFPWFVGVALRIELRNKEITSLRNRLDAAEKALATSNQTIDALMSSNCNINDTLRSRGFNGGSTEERVIAMAHALDKAQEANAELVKLLTEVRDACKANPAMNNHKYDSLGIAVNAAITKGTV